MRCGKSVAEHPLYNTILAFCWNSLVFSILFDEKYFVYRSIIPNYKKNNGIKGSTTLMKATGEQSTVLSFLGFSRNVSGQKLLVYHIPIWIHRGAKLYSQRRANLKILNSAPGLCWTFWLQQMALLCIWDYVSIQHELITSPHVLNWTRNWIYQHFFFLIL